MTRMSYQWNDNKDGMDANLFQVRDRDGFARTEINEKPHQGTAYNEAYKAGLSIETTQFLPSKPGSPTSASTPLNVDGWQDKPTPLKKDWAGFAVDFLRILTVVGLMGFGVAAYLSDDKEITDWKATKVKQASKWVLLSFSFDGLDAEGWVACLLFVLIINSLNLVYLNLSHCIYGIDGKNSSRYSSGSSHKGNPSHDN